MPIKLKQNTGNIDFKVPVKQTGAGGAVDSVNGMTGNVVLEIPSKTSQLENDSGFLTEHQSIKTVNGKNLIGTGTITISGGFLCTITGRGTTAKPYVCDKTYDEILQAVNDGFIPYCIQSGNTYGDQDIMYTYSEHIHTRDIDYIILQQNMIFNIDEIAIPQFLIYKSGEVRYFTSIQERVASVNNKTGYVTLKTSDLENDSGYLTEHQSLENYALKSEIPSVPTNVSALTNDSGYLTLATLPKYTGGVE